MGAQPELIYNLEITALGPLVEEFTAHGIWVFFNEQAPEEVAEFALLHRAPAPLRPLAPGQQVQIGAERYRICAVGPVANANLASLGHLVLKANGADEAELPGDVCIEARPLPTPAVGMQLRVWEVAHEEPHGTL
jgi:PTS system glucitol/sorbitol-specific IIA component